MSGPAGLLDAPAETTAPRSRRQAGPGPSAGLVDAVHRRVLDADGRKPLTPAAVAGIVRSVDPLALPQTVDEVVARVVARVEGLGPIEPLLADPSVSEVMINGPGPVWIERNGTLTRSAVSVDRTAVDLLIERIVGPLGRRVDQRSPCVDGRLGDGSRIHVVVPPVAVDGPYVTIRRFVVADVALEMFAAAPVMALLDDLISAGANVMVTGGTGAGKTTLLNALAGRIDAGRRIVTIEDAAELNLDHPHVVRLEARPESREGGGDVTIRDLVRNALRMRPDRLVVGEVRGPEALDLLHALNTGHAGCLCTIHANGPLDGLRRLAALAAAAAERLPVEAVKDHVAAAMDAIVHVGRGAGAERRVVEIAEVISADRVRKLADGTAVVGALSRPRRLGEGR